MDSHEEKSHDDIIRQLNIPKDTCITWIFHGLIYTPGSKSKGLWRHALRPRWMKLGANVQSVLSTDLVGVLSGVRRDSVRLHRSLGHRAVCVNHHGRRDQYEETYETIEHVYSIHVVIPLPTGRVGLYFLYSMKSSNVQHTIMLRPFFDESLNAVSQMEG